MLKKVALFGWLNYPEWPPVINQSEYDKDFIRISEWIEVDFQEIEVDIVGAKVKAIDETIEEIKEEAIKKVSELQTRKQELLALENK
jgi:hypothetical protein